MYNDSTAKNVTILLIFGCALILLYLGVRILMPGIANVIDIRMLAMLNNITGYQLS